MTSANGTLLGLAKQAAKGTPNVTDNAFTYLLFTQGGVAPNNVVVPLDEEVGGGAMLRDVKKMGVYSGGGIEFIPRPKSLGYLLLGALGLDTPTANGAAYTHTFTLPADQFDAPYYTVRSAPGNMWGEQFQDTRVSALALTWRGANFLRGTAAFMGGLPTPVASMAAWNALAAVDNGPQFISPVSAIELPTGSAATVLAGSFAAGMNIPLDQQWVVGKYSPDAMDITNRTFVVSLTMKIADGTLYKKMAYDPAAGNAWAASLMREANFKLTFASDIEADTGTPYSLTIAGNGQSDETANVVWSASPIGVRAGQQVIMSVTGMFLASPTADATHHRRAGQQDGILLASRRGGFTPTDRSLITEAQHESELWQVCSHRHRRTSLRERAGVVLETQIADVRRRAGNAEVHGPQPL